MNNLVRGVRSFLSFQRPYTFLCNIYYYVFKHNVYKHNFCDIIFTYLWQMMQMRWLKSRQSAED